MLYDWLLRIHLLGVLLFLVTHSVHIPVAFRLRREREASRVARLTRSSFYFVGATHMAMLAIVATGIWMGVDAGWWHMGWWWLALLLLIATWAGMSLFGTRHYDKVRASVGVKQFYPKKNGPPPPDASPEDLETLLLSPRPWVLLAGGLGVFVIVLYLMSAKPF